MRVTSIPSTLGLGLYCKRFSKFKLFFDAGEKKRAETSFSGFKTPQTKEGCHEKAIESHAKPAPDRS